MGGEVHDFRAPPVRKREKERVYCRHRRYELDYDSRRVYCRSCGEEVDAFAALKAIADDWAHVRRVRESLDSEIRAKRKQLNDLERRIRNAKARVRRAER